MSPRNVEKDIELREKRITHILDSAIEIMAVKGIGTVRINDIASAANVSIGNVYHYFKSKDEIFSEILRRGQTTYGKFVREVAAMDSSTPAKLRVLCSLWLSLSNSWAHTILIHTARMSDSSPIEIRRVVTERFTNNLQPVAEMMRQGQEEGDIIEGEPLELAYYFVSLIQGLTLQLIPGAEVPVNFSVEGILSMFELRRRE